MHQPMAYRQSTMSPEEIAAALLDPTVDKADRANAAAEKMSARVEEVCERIMQTRKTYRGHHTPVFWWDDEMAAHCSICLRARRLVQRAHDTSRLEACYEEYKVAKRARNRESFLKLYDALHSDPGSGANRMVLRRIHTGASSSRKVVADTEEAANTAIKAVEPWLAVAGLELTSQKTEAEGKKNSSKLCVNTDHVSPKPLLATN